MYLRFTVTLLAFLGVLSVAADGRAQPAPADEVQRGVDLYLDLEYEQAVAVLSAALEQTDLDDERKLEGYQYLALSHLALRDEASAREALAKLLEIDRRFRLPTTVSQTARELLEELRRALPPEVRQPDPPAAVAAELSQTASPLEPRPSTAISITIIVADPSGTHQKVSVHHRVRGQTRYSVVHAMRVGQGRYAVTIPGMFVEPPAVEYYVVAVDAAGVAVASEGSEAAPLAIQVAGSQAEATPVYKKWWFWAGIGTALLAGTVGVLALSGGDGPGMDSTVTVTVTE